jgi:hypothetical protein
MKKMNKKRMVIIGEAFNTASEPKGLPMHEWSGAFLSKSSPTVKFMLRWFGISYAEFTELFDTYNIYNRAREKMPDDDLLRMLARYDFVICMGQTAAREFWDHRVKVPFLYSAGRSANIAIFPHPSGKNRVLNDAAVRAACEKLGKKIIHMESSWRS